MPMQIIHKHKIFSVTSYIIASALCALHGIHDVSFYSTMQSNTVFQAFIFITIPLPLIVPHVHDIVIFKSSIHNTTHDSQSSIVSLIDSKPWKYIASWAWLNPRHWSIHNTSHSDAGLL